MGASEKKVIETRCGHGFLGSQVKCPSGCHRDAPDAVAAAPTPRKPNTHIPGSHPGFVSLKGATLAGAKVIDRAKNIAGVAQWDCLLVCGHRRTIAGIALRDADKAGRLIRCKGCKDTDSLIGTSRIVGRAPSSYYRPDYLLECTVCKSQRRLGYRRVTDVQRKGETLRCFTCKPHYERPPRRKGTVGT